MYFTSPSYCRVWCVLEASSAIIHSHDCHGAVSVTSYVGSGKPTYCQRRCRPTLAGRRGRLLDCQLHSPGLFDNVRDLPFFCTSTDRIWLPAGCYSSIAVALLGGPTGLQLCVPGSGSKHLNLCQWQNNHAVWSQHVSGSQTRGE